MVVFTFMENTNWYPVFYNGLETNVEVTRCGKVRRVRVDWLKYTTNAKIGEVDFSILSLNKGYHQLNISIKNFKSISLKININ